MVYRMPRGWLNTSCLEITNAMHSKYEVGTKSASGHGWCQRTLTLWCPLFSLFTPKADTDTPYTFAKEKRVHRASPCAESLGSAPVLSQVASRCPTLHSCGNGAIVSLLASISLSLTISYNSADPKWWPEFLFRTWKQSNAFVITYVVPSSHMLINVTTHLGDLAFAAVFWEAKRGLETLEKVFSSDICRGKAWSQSDHKARFYCLW